MVNERAPELGMNGPPKGPAGARVSATRQGVIGMKLSPEALETVMLTLVPVIAGLNASVAVKVCDPTVARVAEKVPVALVRVLSAGSVAALSVLLK